MDNEKSIPHFKIAPLDYSCLSVYLQNCKTTRNQILLTASSFCLKIGMSKYIWIWSLLSPLWPNFKIVS